MFMAAYPFDALLFSVASRNRETGLLLLEVSDEAVPIVARRDRIAQINASGGTTSHCTKGASPVPNPGTIGITLA
jgi:hypothetical protein